MRERHKVRVRESAREREGRGREREKGDGGNRKNTRSSSVMQWDEQVMAVAARKI